MKIKKDRLKAIILEEIAAMQEEGLTGTLDAERAMAMSSDPFAGLARRRQGAELKKMARSKREDRPEVASAKRELADMGIMNPGKGDPLMRGKNMQDVDRALRAMNAEPATINAIMRELDAYYR